MNKSKKLWPRDIRCIVAGNGGNGPGFFGCVIEKVTEDEYGDGVHYDIARSKAEESGWDGPFVVFDENDGHKWLFKHVFDSHS